MEFPRRATVAASISILPNLTHMDTLNVAGNHIGPWIMNVLDSIEKKMTLIEAYGIYLLNLDDNEPSNEGKHDILRDVDLVMNSLLKIGLPPTRYHYLLANDGAQIRYRVFNALSSKSTLNLVMIQSDIKIILGWILSQKCNITVYILDLRGIDNSAAVL